MSESHPRSGLNYPNRMALITIKALEEVMGRNGVNAVGKGEVAVYNRGGAPLKITKVTTSCGCTVGQMTKNVIMPGEEAPRPTRGCRPPSSCP